MVWELALNADAVLSIFKAKGRPLTDPLIVHIAEPKDADELIELDHEKRHIFRTLSTQFWPGLFNTNSKTLHENTTYGNSKYWLCWYTMTQA